MTSISVHHIPEPHVPDPGRAGTMSVSFVGWLAALSFAVVVFLGSHHLWVSLGALAAINACSFFLFQEWVDRTRH